MTARGADQVNAGIELKSTFKLAPKEVQRWSYRLMIMPAWHTVSTSVRLRGNVETYGRSAQIRPALSTVTATVTVSPICDFGGHSARGSSVYGASES
eukprot:753891-Hanusia_phi.AAC.1